VLHYRDDIGVSSVVLCPPLREWPTPYFRYNFNEPIMKL